MTRRFIASFLFTFSLFIVPFAASADNTLCYCRYGLTDTGGWDAEDAKWCSNEIAAYGPVTRGSNQTSLCQNLCTSNSQQYVGVTSLNMEGFQNPYLRVDDETEYCVFHKGVFSTSPSQPLSFPDWKPRHENCKNPLNDSELKWPDACSFCYCRFKTDGQNAACAGKTTMVHPTSYPSGCPALCGKLGLDPEGSGTGNVDDKCNWQASNGCSQPFNPNSAGCKAESDKAQAEFDADKFQANKGSPLALLLPLGDISLPSLIARVIRQIMGVVGAIAFAYFIWGGVQYMTAAGDDKKITSAKGTIIAAASGLVAIFLSYAILTLIINAIK